MDSKDKIEKIKNHKPLEGLFSTKIGNQFITGKVRELIKFAKDYPIINLKINKIPDIPHYDNPEENLYVMIASLDYPVILMVDEQNNIIRVLDGNHRIQKALYLGDKTIKAKLIPKKDIKSYFGKSSLQETIRRILKEDYSPAGDEYTPGKFIAHVSNPLFRKDIKVNGLQTSVGDCYQLYVNREQTSNDKIKCNPAIFATDSLDRSIIFDSTYDDDIWIINTECAGVTWYKDRHYEGNQSHIVTFENIPPKCVKLLYKGTGESYS